MTDVVIEIDGVDFTSYVQLATGEEAGVDRIGQAEIHLTFPDSAAFVFVPTREVRVYIPSTLGDPVAKGLFGGFIAQEGITVLPTVGSQTEVVLQLADYNQLLDSIISPIDLYVNPYVHAGTLQAQIAELVLGMQYNGHGSVSHLIDATNYVNAITGSHVFDPLVFATGQSLRQNLRRLLAKAQEYDSALRPRFFLELADDGAGGVICALVVYDALTLPTVSATFSETPTGGQKPIVSVTPHTRTFDASMPLVNFAQSLWQQSPDAGSKLFTYQNTSSGAIYYNPYMNGGAGWPSGSGPWMTLPVTDTQSKTDAEAQEAIDKIGHQKEYPRETFAVQEDNTYIRPGNAVHVTTTTVDDDYEVTAVHFEFIAQKASYVRYALTCGLPLLELFDTGSEGLTGPPELWNTGHAELANPSFEDRNTDGSARFWTVETVGDGTGVVDTTTSGDGRNSFHFNCPTPSDEVTLTSDMFHAKYLTDGIAGAKNALDLKMKRGSHNVDAIALYVDWYDQALTLIESEVLVTGLNLLTTFSAYHYVAVWPSVTPENTAAARLRFHCQPSSGAYDWWIDALEFAKPDHTSVMLNSGDEVFTRGRTNFIEGPGISITQAEDAVEGKVDITISTVPSAPSGVVGGYRDEVVPTAAATTVTLTYTPSKMMTVARNGVEQSSALGHWSLATNVLTFSDAFDGTDEVVAAYLIGGVVPISPPTVLVSTVGVGKAKSLWNGSSNDPAPTGWYTAAYSDAAWSVTSAGGGGASSVIPGAAIIWPPGGLAHLGQAILHRNTFTLPSGAVTSAVLILAADDINDEVWVNEVAVSVGPPRLSDIPATINIPQSALIPGGTNLIAFKAHDTGGSGFDLQYKVTVS